MGGAGGRAPRIKIIKTSLTSPERKNGGCGGQSPPKKKRDLAEKVLTQLYNYLNLLVIYILARWYQVSHSMVALNSCAGYNIYPIDVREGKNLATMTPKSFSRLDKQQRITSTFFFGSSITVIVKNL